MKFEIINDNKDIIFVTHQISCIPTQKQLDMMSKNNWKFRIDGKIATKKAMNELLKGDK